MRDGIQTFLNEAGESGCYALCLIDVAEEYTGKDMDIVRCLLDGVKSGAIQYRWNDAGFADNMYVSYPALFLEQMTGKKWSVTHGEAYLADQKPPAGTYVINRWERKATGRTTGHFERNRFHPVENSLTVSQGKLVSTRICEVING